MSLHIERSKWYTERNMYKGDKIPAPLPNKQFPIGDIVDASKDERVNHWFEKIEKMDQNQFAAWAKLNHAPTAILSSAPGYKTYHAGMRLCKKWDEIKGGDRHYTVTGYVLTLAFNHETHYLPTYNTDFTEELLRMQRPNEQLHRAQNFARVAWHGMQTYPRVHATMERLYEHAKTRYDILDTENSEYFQAGMALPYVLSATSRLIGYTPDFTGMIDEKQDLRTTPFGRLFTDKIALAPDVVLPKKIIEDSN